MGGVKRNRKQKGMCRKRNTHTERDRETESERERYVLKWESNGSLWRRGGTSHGRSERKTETERDVQEVELVEASQEKVEHHTGGVRGMGKREGCAEK